jgi:hypothetical protein
MPPVARLVICGDLFTQERCPGIVALGSPFVSKSIRAGLAVVHGIIRDYPALLSGRLACTSRIVLEVDADASIYLVP